MPLLDQEDNEIQWGPTLLCMFENQHLAKDLKHPGRLLDCGFRWKQLEPHGQHISRDYLIVPSRSFRRLHSVSCPILKVRLLDGRRLVGIG